MDNQDWFWLSEKFVLSLSTKQKQMLIDLLSHDNAMNRIYGITPCAFFMFKILKEEGFEQSSES